MFKLLSSPWAKLLLIALLILAMVPLSSRLPDGLEYTLEKLGITSSSNGEIENSGR